MQHPKCEVFFVRQLTNAAGLVQPREVVRPVDFRLVKYGRKENIWLGKANTGPTLGICVTLLEKATFSGHFMALSRLVLALS